MSQAEESVIIEPVPLQEVLDSLRKTRPFAQTPPELMRGLESVDRVTAKAGATLVGPGEPWRYYWLVLDGEIHAVRQEQEGACVVAGCAGPGEGFGEAPFLIGKEQSPFVIVAAQDSHLVRFSAQEFWEMMACCPAARRVVLADMSKRFHTYQVEALHREKLVALGTLAAGLMHELHNPGSAAKRAASQLRQNLLRLQQMSLRFSDQPKTQEQLDCIRGLLERTMHECHGPALSSLEQADAEEAMAEWLSAAGVENAYDIAPALVDIGFSKEELACARVAFDAESFSDALNWLQALVSSVSLVCAIEESISRVSDLVMAVKKFAYDDRTPGKEVDVHDNLKSTLTILGHKLRLKRIAVEKSFAANPSVIRTKGSALSQVWTNLIDNAVDASPEEGKLEIATWSEPGWLAVSIADHGAGIPEDVLPHIFDAFFTTKPQGHGTGLGLEIVHRIVTQKFGGKIDVESQPGSTRFIVRLPVDAAAPTAS